MQNQANAEITPRDLLRVFFRHKLIIAICSITLIPFVHVKQEMVTPSYQASVVMMVTGLKETDSDYYREVPTGGMGLASSLIYLVRTKIVVERVVNYLRLFERPLDFGEMQRATRIKKYFIKRNINKFERSLKEMTPDQRKQALFNRAVDKLIGSMFAEPIEQTNLFEIKVSDYDPSAAVVIANSLSRSYIIFDLEQRLVELTSKYGKKHSIVKRLQNHIDSEYKILDGRPLPDIEAIGPASVKIIGQARITGTKKNFNRKAGFILAFLIGLFGGIVLAYILDYFSQKFRTRHDIEKYLAIPFLGSIPVRRSKDKLVMNNSNPGNKYIKFYREISINLDILIKNKDSRSILVSDAEKSEDTAAVIANIGYCLAHMVKHCKILIIDANFRNPMMSKAFNIPDTPGLVDVIEGKVLFENAVHDVGFNVNVLSAGNPGDNIAALLNSSMMSDVIKRAKDTYEVVLIFCSDLRNYHDAVELSSLTDAFVLVLNAKKVRRFIAKMAITPLEEKKVQILGAILNNRKMDIPGFIYKWL